MKVETYFTPGQVDPGILQGRDAVVFDVIRATTSIVEAIVSGARAVHPTGTIEEAMKLRASLGRDGSLLCGERKGVRIEGFDLGNSPAEFTPETVAGKQLVMTTTNGTGAIAAAGGAERVLVGAFTNLAAVAETIADSGALVVVCAGKEGRFSLDDALAAGHLLMELERVGVELDPGDGAKAALALGERFEPDVAFLAGTAAGRALAEVGLSSDLELVARRDAHREVPKVVDRTVRSGAEGGGEGS